ncbi:YbdK family carboxylate-amine ligase [Microbacterium sp. 179-I 3D3 NHS]|uniref:carboxylate-amine ligase n=1 Tax=Microbacterium sp. 179-I 3D3 NHS TaxID=3142382 RepID=UPI0039A3A48E
MTRFGVEEEFLFLDEASLVPLSLSPETRARLTRPRDIGRVTTEYLASQLECITDPLSSHADAESQLRDLRGFIAAQTQGHGAIAAAVGAPFATTRSPLISPSPHYDDVSARLAHLTREHEVNGLHVHVEVHDDDERVRALNRVRGWLPVLLALTVNSPFAGGVDAGFASWRSILIRRLPTGWCPPRFHDVEDYRRHVHQLLDLGTIGEASSIGWDVRLSERFPTVEVRVFDTQLTAEDAVLAALLSRALVLNDADPATDDPLDGIDASLWSAARSGMEARIIDPTTGEVADAWQVAERMLDAATPVLQQFGDEDYVRDGLDRIRTTGTGAARQRRALAAGGMPALAGLLRAEGAAAPAPAA